MFLYSVPVDCINQSAVQYHVPAVLIVSVLKTEGGKVGLAKPNKDGSVDYGPMQINSIWLKRLNEYGYTKEQVQYDPCINVKIGSWILAQGIANGRDFWHGVGDYHSHTPVYNQMYKFMVKTNYEYFTNL